MYDLINLGIELDLILDDDTEGATQRLSKVSEGMDADQQALAMNMLGLRDIDNKSPFYKIKNAFGNDTTNDA